MTMQRARGGISRCGGTQQSRRTAVVLALLAVALYAPLIWWGAPQATGPDRTKTFATDEILPLEGLAEMHSTFVASKPDRNYGYPWWHYFVVSAAQAPYLAYQFVTGGLRSPAPQYPFGFRDPVSALWALTLIGRSVSVLMGAGTVVAAYYFSKTLWEHQTGVVAAVLTMLNYLMFYYSRTGNLDVPAFFWSSIGLVIFAKILVEGFTVRRAAWLGVFAGLAMATKDQAVILFGPMALILLFPPLFASGNRRYPVRPILVGLAASIAVYLVGTGMLVDPRRHFMHVYSLFFDPERVTKAAAYLPVHPRTWIGALGLAGDYLQAFAATSAIPVLAVAAAGALLVLRSTPRRLILLFPVPALFLMLVWPTGIVVRRYLLPLMLVIDAFAAVAVVAVRRSRFHWAAAPLMLVLCGWRLLIAVDLTYAQYRDTRYAASEWLQANTRSGDRVEYFGSAHTMPHLPGAVRSGPVAGRTQWVGEFGHGPQVIQYLAREGPEYVAIVPDWTSPPAAERSLDCPPEVYSALLDGTVGYRLVAVYPTRSLLNGRWRRPDLDNPSVCPPVRIFARNDVVSRIRSRLVTPG